ncbi:MAG: helix-turn-helix domain-containing protein [Clostridia bacterium]|nr:helix-turn-helix domain-containing protein [Clostridia bacterium]
MIYQTKHSVNADSVVLEKGVDLNFPAHIHRNFELVTVTDGELLVTVGKKEYLLKAGESVLIFPNQIHELKTPNISAHTLCIFSPQLVRAYGKIFDSKIPECNKFNLDKIYQNQIDELDDKKSILELKGLLYSVVACFDKQSKYISVEKDRKDLLFTVFKFVEENYARECKLSVLADKTSYNYVYLSKYFTKRTGITYTEYVNRYRVNESCYRLINTDKTILEIAYECGFDSLRSFNRNFKRITGISPSQYRINSI